MKKYLVEELVYGKKENDFFFEAKSIKQVFELQYGIDLNMMGGDSKIGKNQVHFVQDENEIVVTLIA